MELTKDIILEAWRNEEYRESLPQDVRKEIPARPTAEDGSALGDAELEAAAGGVTPLAPLGVASWAALGGTAGAAGTAGFIASVED